MTTDTITADSGGRLDGPTIDMTAFAATAAQLAAPLAATGNMLVALSATLSSSVAPPAEGGGSSSSIPGSGAGGNAGGGGTKSGKVEFPVLPDFTTLLTDIFGGVGDALGNILGSSSSEDKALTDEENSTADDDTIKDNGDSGDKAEESSKKSKKANDDEADSDKKLWASKLANALAGSKKLAKIKKAYDIAQVISKTAVGIQEAVASAPFPANIPAIAFATAQGVANLKAVKKGQAHDGLDKIPSSGTYLLEKGERVVGKRLNQDLSAFLGTGAGGGGGASNSVSNYDRSSNSNNTFNPTINLTIGDGASEDAVFANRGAVETMIREIYADYAQASPFGA